MLLRDQLTCISKFEVTRISCLEKTLEANLSRTEGQCVIYSVKSRFLLLDGACLSNSHSTCIFLKGMDSYLFFLLRDGFWSFFGEVYILKMLHFAINDFFSQSQPNIAGNAEIVNAPAD